jgi:hypothetical protein
MNRSIKDALVAEEKFFRSRPVRLHHSLDLFSDSVSLTLLLISSVLVCFLINRFTAVSQIVWVSLNWQRN